MKKDFYTYCTLKYHHSPFLDESINIGVLIYFHKSQDFSFTYSKSLNRIKSLYSNVPEKTIKEYIRQIDRKLNHFTNLKSDLFPLVGENDFSDFVFKNILVYDASCLKFDGFKTQRRFDFSDEFISETIVKKLFIEDSKTHSNSPQEPKILKHLYKELNSVGFTEKANVNRYIKDIDINTATGKFNFDFAWKNGVWNLVKPVGFDLKTPEGIIGKARQNLGEFTDFFSEVSKEEYKTNILVGKPTDKGLYASYDKALKILEKSPNTDIIEEDNFRNYSYKVLKAVTSEN